MIFVLDTAIGLCVWIPFTVGKTVALLSVCVTHDLATRSFLIHF